MSFKELVDNRWRPGPCVRAALGTIVFALLAVASSGQDRTRPTFTLRLYNLASVPVDVLTQAREELVEVFGAAGIGIEWLDLSDRALGIDKESKEPRKLDVRLIIRSVCFDPDPQRGLVIGRVLGSDDSGGTVVACYDQILSVARDHNQPPADLLALTMAHEVGHLLLPAPVHTPSGIMHSYWTAREIRQVDIGALRFTTPQAILMQVKIAGATGMPAK